jgi:threonine/homoserine/homoserine lactone efflux protein
VTASLPLALAIALSPFAIIPAVLLLFTPRPRPTSSAFVVGWFFGVALATGLGALLADVLLLGKDGSTWASSLRVALGMALVVVAIRSWLGRHDPSDPPSWMSSIRSAEPTGAAKLGLVLSAANPKVLLLALAGGGAIASEMSAYGQQVVGAVLFAAVASTSVIAPLLLFVTLGARALPALEGAGEWLDRNSKALVAVVLLFIGFGLVITGARSLLS